MGVFIRLVLISQFTYLTGCTINFNYHLPVQTTDKTSAEASDTKQLKKEKSPFKLWKDVLKDTEKYKGMLTFHMKDDRTLYLELPKDHLGKEYGLIMHFSKAIGDYGSLIDGLPLSDTQLIKFERVGNNIHMIGINPKFTAAKGSPMEYSLSHNVGHSIIEAFKIESINKENQNMLVDITPFFVSDYADVSKRLKSAAKSPMTFDKTRSYIGKIKAFKRNIEIDSELTFKGDPKAAFHTVSHSKSIPVGVRYSLFDLPETPMVPRYADDRVGHFITAIKDLSRDKEDSKYVNYIQRWRLERKDHSAELSEPVEPVVYYIDKSVPHEYRKYVKEGIEAWNKAFEEAGFKNAIVAKEAPEDDPEWDAEDIRYSTIRWSAAHGMGYAVGPSQKDPRTGEILNADILITSEFVTSWKGLYEKYAGPEEIASELTSLNKIHEINIDSLPGYICMNQSGKSLQLAAQYLFMIANGMINTGSEMPEEFLGQALKDLVMHEVGHTLGLRHNFKSSSGVPNEKLHDTEFTHKYGVALSVMDYTPVNVSPDREQQGHYYNVGVGAYDKWAIKYAYKTFYNKVAEVDSSPEFNQVTNPDEELEILHEIASQCNKPLHTYGTDEDNWLGSYALDPRSSAGDLGSDNIQFARKQMELIENTIPSLEKRLVEDGESYDLLRSGFATLLRLQISSVSPLFKTIGGVYTNRNHKDDPNEELPFVVVPAKQQERAVETITSALFNTSSFEYNKELLNKLAPPMISNWATGYMRYPVDFPLHIYAYMIQQSVLNELLSSVRLFRIIDNAYRIDSEEKAFELTTLFRRLTDSIFEEILFEYTRDISSPDVEITSLRRNVQKLYVEKLISILFSNSMPPDAIAISRAELTRTSDGIEAVKNKEMSKINQIHCEELVVKIQKALNAAATYEIKK